jgi:hypothetical protein
VEGDEGGGAAPASASWALTLEIPTSATSAPIHPTRPQLLAMSST